MRTDSTKRRWVPACVAAAVLLLQLGCQPELEHYSQAPESDHAIVVRVWRRIGKRTMVVKLEGNGTRPLEVARVTDDMSAGPVVVAWKPQESRAFVLLCGAGGNQIEGVRCFTGSLLGHDEAEKNMREALRVG